MQRKHSSWHYVRSVLRQVASHPANAGHRRRAIVRAVRWQVRKRVRPTPVDVPFEGMVLRCYPDSGSASNVIYFTSRYDPLEMAFVERYLRPGDGFLDVGANIGTYTLLAASLVGPTGRIIAVEPLPVAAARLRENVERNHLRNVEVHEAAAGRAEGTIGFLDFDVSSAIDHNEDRRGREPITVRVARLDALAEEHELAMGKLDVEGMELDALRGAERLLERATPGVWLVELYEWQLAKQGTSSQEVVDLLEAAGYVTASFDPTEGALTTPSDGWRTAGNHLFVHRSRLEAVHERLAQAFPARAR